MADEDLALLAVAWRSIGLRAADVEWRLAAPALLSGTLASRLRGALGPALAAAGARQLTLLSIPGDSGVPPVWFLGWECPAGPVTRMRAGLRCVGAIEPDWPELAAALARMRLPSASRPGALVDAIECAVTWHGSTGGAASDFGLPMIADPHLAAPADACVVEAVTPLQLRADGKIHRPPPLDVLVRSAGDRFRKLCEHWGSGGGRLPTVVGQAVREAREAHLSWARGGRAQDIARRSSRSGQLQLLGGVQGVFAYEDVSPLAMAVLAMGAELGVGKGTAFGCGQLRIYRAVTS
jgi:hypothetical protein